MATFSVEVPDDKIQLIGEAFAQQYSLDSISVRTDDDGEELKGAALVQANVEFARQKIIEIINGTVRNHLVWQQQQQMNEIPAVPIDIT